MEVFAQEDGRDAYVIGQFDFLQELVSDHLKGVFGPRLVRGHTHIQVCDTCHERLMQKGAIQVLRDALFLEI